MAMKLTKAEATQKADLVAGLESASVELDAALVLANDRLAEVRDGMEAAVDAYAERLGEARDFRDGLVARLQDEIDCKSERWQEGSKGEAAIALKDEWESLDLDDLEIDMPGDFDELDLAHSSALTETQEEPAE